MRNPIRLLVLENMPKMQQSILRFERGEGGRGEINEIVLCLTCEPKRGARATMKTICSHIGRNIVRSCFEVGAL